jgi:hypothetical protein
MLNPDLFRDNRVLASAGAYEVLFERQPIALTGDQETIGIHIVRQNGHDAMYLRAVPYGDALLIVFDLRNVHTDLNEIQRTHPSDVPGLILYTLRAHFRTVPELMAACMSFPLDVLTIEPDAVTQPEPHSNYAWQAEAA